MFTTSDPKPHTLRVRINDEMNNHIERITTKTGKKVSEYIRGLIEQDMRRKP